MQLVSNKVENNLKKIIFFLFRMYLTEAQVSSILNSNFFQTSFTSSKIHYALYQGKTNATVHTLRFNCNETFDPLTVRSKIYQYLTDEFQANSVLLGSISYDFLLVNSEQNPKSYYIWRSNSNAVHFTAHEESYFTLSYMNVANFVRSIFSMDASSFDVNFENSKVVIDRILAVVLC
jgi:hypothetical protein